MLHMHHRIAPIKIAILPLVNKDGIPEIAKDIFRSFKPLYNSTYDKGGSVGRRYARNDEIGTPYCITIDYETKEDKAVTVRDRDTTEQIRVPISRLEDLFYSLLQKDLDFKEAMKSYPKVPSDK